MKIQRVINVLVVIALVLVTGVQMRTGDMFAKLAKGQKLSESDIATLRLKMNQVENMTDIWSGNTVGTQVSFGHIEALSGKFETPPLGASIITASQTIPNDTITTLVLTQAMAGEALVDVTDNTHLLRPAMRDELVFTGRMYSPANNTGVRVLSVVAHMSDGSEITNGLVSTNAVQGQATMAGFLGPVNIDLSTGLSVDYFYFIIYQNSGGDLSMSVRMYIFPAR